MVCYLGASACLQLILCSFPVRLLLRLTVAGLKKTLDIVFGLDIQTEIPSSIHVKSFIELLCATSVFVMNN